jgi:hypothetical protein
MKKIKQFASRMKKGLAIEARETIEIPKHIKNGHFKKAGEQVGDLFKMTGLGIIWVIPGGGILVAVILKVFHKSRPSAFRPSKEEEARERKK